MARLRPEIVVTFRFTWRAMAIQLAVIAAVSSLIGVIVGASL